MKTIVVPQKICDKIAVVLAVLLLSGPLAFPQNPKVDSKWWTDKTIVAKLNLTPAQVRQLETNMVEFRARLDALRNEIKAADRDVEKLRASKGKDPVALRELLNQRYARRAELEKIVLTLSIRQGAVLSDNQKATLKTIQSQ